MHRKAALTDALALLTLLVPGAALCAQEWPDGWEHRLDRPDADPAAVEFVNMAPGWHVTTGPAAILYRPDQAARGDYRVTTEIFLFDPQGRREAFGIFVGGSDLQGPDQAYTYFLIRDGREYLVKRRHGDDATTVAGWAGNDAIRAFEDRPEGETSVLNELSVEVRGDQVRFLVNGTEVDTLPRGDLPLDGIVGLRVNHRLNLHVTRLDVEAAGAGR